MAEMKVEGLDNLLTEVAKLGQEAAKTENTALREAGEIVKDAIKNITPERTGRLKRSIALSRVKTKDGVKFIEVAPGKDAYWSRFVEFGTVKMKAKPFMAPGFESSKAQAMEAIEQELKKGLGL